MPSFAIHTICGTELLKEINLNENEQKEFLIGNIIPDVSRVKNFKNLDKQKRRQSIQDRKVITHFRTNKNNIMHDLFYLLFIF